LLRVTQTHALSGRQFLHRDLIFYALPQVEHSKVESAIVYDLFQIFLGFEGCELQHTLSRGLHHPDVRELRQKKHFVKDKLAH
jgi:hypothetical protein